MVKDENKKIWTAVITTAVVVAVVASLITANLTGNVIKVNRDIGGAYNVYTKAEIDNKLSILTTNQKVLDMLTTKCTIYSVAVPDEARSVTGEKICEERNVGSCLFTLRYQDLNAAINGQQYPHGSNLGIIERCGNGGLSTETVAYCCYS